VTRVAWFHCFSGIAGDMALGSLVDAGADLEEVRHLLQPIAMGEWSVTAEAVLRGGIAATHIEVHATEDGVVRTYANITGLIEGAGLPDRVRQRALATFAGLAEVEGRLHHRNPAQVHFHEVGGVDAIVDIVGTCAALELMDIDRVETSAVATGTGMVRSSHGLLPNPSPAAVELLAGVPTYGRDVTVELTTPTGAALVKALAAAHGPLPAMTVEASGFGAGRRELEDMPNCTQVVIGEASDTSAKGLPPTAQPLVLLETNIDDATGETLAHAVDALLRAGANDAWLTPATMKKGRPGHVLSVMADVALVDQLRRLIQDETGSLGVRATAVSRWASPRRTEVVEVDGMPVRVKISPGRAKAEHDDVASLAVLRHLPLREASRRAEAEWWSRRPEPEPGPGPGPGPEPHSSG
jgi:pyridinium-3,5-bisthiocarboxylic acid mononucleotide nickel chelatase